MERVLRQFDRTQQRHTATAFVFGVIKKYGDDNGGTLAASLVQSAFLSLFPLLLILVTSLGLIASGSPGLRQDVLKAVAGQFPLVGNQLKGNVHALHRSSVTGLIIGLLGLVWGGTGLAKSGQFTMQQIWNLPGPARPGYWQRLGRAVVFFGVLLLVVVVTTALTALDGFSHHSMAVLVGAEALAVVANVGLYLLGFRVLTPKGIPIRSLVPGAIAGGVVWTALQPLGGYVVRHSQHTGSVFGVFAAVLGLLAWLYLAVQVTVYAAEVNVVLARRLWPRSLIQPPLTEADRSSLALQALQNQRREEQHVTVTFHDRPPGERPGQHTPWEPGQISPPARPPGATV